MGGFILCKIFPENTNSNNYLEIFKKKGMKISIENNLKDYKLITFHKRAFENKNFFCFENGNFMASLGTPVYKEYNGEKAAVILYNDFKKNLNLDFRNFNGNFCYIIFIDNKLYLFNDYNGSYHIYHDVNYNIISSSFLVIANYLNHKDIYSQGLYEYIFYGATFGSNCILKDVIQLGNKKIVQLKPGLSFIKKEYSSSFNPDIKKNFYEFNRICFGKLT